jgi:hypothetical protein
MMHVVFGSLDRPHAVSVAFGRMALAVTLGVCIPAVGRAQSTPFNLRILGRWRGTSICVKATWNAACHDEQVIYRVARSAQAADRITLQADRREGTGTVSMGDLQFWFDEAANSWVSELTTSRAHVLWSFRVDQAHLVGRLVELPSRRLMRNVTAVRDSS